MEPICIYTDGACSNNGYSNACAGIGIFFGFNDKRNVSERIEGKQTNNVAELLALLRTGIIIKEELDKNTIIHIYSDSQYAIKCVTTYGEKLEKKNWKNGNKKIPNLELVKRTYLFFKIYSNVLFKYIRAHTSLKDPHSIGNQNADRLAQAALINNNKSIKNEKNEKNKKNEINNTLQQNTENKNDYKIIIGKMISIEEKLDKILNILNV